MSRQQTFFRRLGNWFRGCNSQDALPLAGGNSTLAPRVTFLRPWARRDAAIYNLQESFRSLTELMSTIRDNLERQSRRQDELLAYLAHLPEAIRAIPENSRVHGEMLQAIHQQLAQQNAQQEKLGEILERLSQNGEQHRKSLGELNEGMESLRQADEMISANLNSLGHALQGVSRTTAAGAHVLEQMQQRLDSRDSQLELILRRHSVRFTVMLAIAIALATAGLAGACIVGYMLLGRG